MPTHQLPDPDDADPDDFRPIIRSPKPRWDDDEVDPEATTYTAADHGPEPTPEWVITADAARQYELGILKSGKEADVHLVQRQLGDQVNILAAKRYRDLDERTFRNDAKYRQRAGDRRADLAIARGTRAGIGFRAARWVETEWDALGRLWEAGAPVPYPVQKLGIEVMMEYLGDDDEAAPRLVHAATSLDRDDLAELFAQAVEVMRVIARAGLVHGDLSPYNLLVWHDRLYVIDFPQAVDPIINRDGLQLLERDVRNISSWFASKGVDNDATALHRELLKLYR
jgi:RIO kinase 1